MGPLEGMRIVEIAGIGPGPFCAMMLADLGADVLRVERPGTPMPGPHDVLQRGRATISLDLKAPRGRDTLLRLVERADALLEGFRPGVMERLGLGPEPCLARNPKLVYGRMTGWGQEGPLAQAAGHDINYIALAGALWPIGRRDQRPVPPLNLVGDFGGGGMLLACGMLAALLAVARGGQGQVVDAAMVDGAALLMAPFYGLLAQGRWRNARESNRLDGACPYYDTYECADGKWVAVGALEPQFFALLLDKLGLEPTRFARREDPERWPAIRAEFAAIFRTQPRDHWATLFEGSDACVAPVLDLEEAPRHPHNAARNSFTPHPAPAPRFSATPTVRSPAPGAPASAAQLAAWGLAQGDLEPG